MATKEETSSKIFSFTTVGELWYLKKAKNLSKILATFGMVKS